MSFAKLVSEIIDSSIWDEPEYILKTWVAFLAKKDEHGFVGATYKAMKRTTNLKDDDDGDKFAASIKCLEGEDKESRTPDFQGRRIKKIDGGWIVLNHEKYRLKENVIKEQTRLRVKKCRDKLKNTDNKKNQVTQCNVTNVTPALPSVSVYESVYESVFLDFWKVYPKPENIIDAYEGWGKITDNKENIVIMAGIYSDIVKKDVIEQKYIPLPANWIAKCRWKDGTVLKEYEKRLKIKEQDKNKPDPESYEQSTGEDCENEFKKLREILFNKGVVK